MSLLEQQNGLGSLTPNQGLRSQAKIKRQRERLQKYEVERKRQDAVRSQIEGHGIRQPSVVATHSTTPSIRFTTQQEPDSVPRTPEPAASVTRSVVTPA